MAGTVTYQIFGQVLINPVFRLMETHLGATRADFTAASASADLARWATGKTRKSGIFEAPIQCAILSCKSYLTI